MALLYKVQAGNSYLTFTAVCIIDKGYRPPPPPSAYFLLEKSVPALRIGRLEAILSV